MITSTKNRQVVKAARLKKRAMRDADRLFLVESAQVALEAIGAGVVEVLYHLPGEAGRVDPVVDAARAAGVPEEAVTEQVMAHLTSTVTPQGVVAVARFVDVRLEDVPPGALLVPVLCSVRDPGNAGTILRSADAAGADAIVFAGTSVDVYNPKTVRASAGSLFHLPVVRGASPEEAVGVLRSRGARVLAAAADGEDSLYDVDFSTPTAVLFGNEAWGLEAEVRALADRTVRVPIRGRSESLNLAAAAALLMFEAARSRERGEGGALQRIAALMGAGAHDIRSPLTALSGFVSTLAANWDRIPDEQRHEIVSGMAVDGQRVNALVRLLVDTIRIEAGVPLTGLGEAAEAAEAARWVAGVFGKSADLPDVTVEGSARVPVEPERLRAMLLALCEGAMWWASDGPIHVSIRGSSSGVEVEVTRGGEGPSAEEAAGLFAGPESGGKVALYAAHRLASWLGGDLTAAAGEGIRLVLALPPA